MQNELFVVRDTVILSPKQLRDEIKHPQNVRLKVDDQVAKYPLDIGSLAYSKRSMDYRNVQKHSKGTPVVLASLRIERLHMLTCIFDELSKSNYRDATRYYIFKQYRNIINECDTSGHSYFMQSVDACRNAFMTLSSEWRHKAKINKISYNTASVLQLEFKHIIELCFDKNEFSLITSNVSAIPYRRGVSKPPTEQHFQHYVGIALSLARNIQKFIVEERVFPFKIKSNYFETFVFHGQGGNVKTPYTTDLNSLYDFENGCLLNYDDWKKTVSIYNYSEYEKRLANFNEVNINKRHKRRIDFATLSMQSYMKIFVLLTGGQPSEIVQLQFDEDYFKTKDYFKNQFRAIKFRAQGREVTYSLGDQYGYELFLEYLQLRKWVLNGEHCDYLFFHTLQSPSGDNKFTQIRMGRGFYSFIHRIRGVYVPNDFEDITSSPTRKYKNLILSELKISLETRASVLNHTIQTNQSSYTETTIDRQAKEFNSHWAVIKQARRHINLLGKDNVKTVSGHCIDDKNPRADIENPPIEPNCNVMYGCLFCDKYSCHADEEDVYKLYSLFFVIDILRSKSTDLLHTEELFNKLSIRINEILVGISDRSPSHKLMVDRVKNKVMVLGILTPYWEKRLDQYERMGVI